MSITETIVVREKEPPQHPRGVSYRKPIEAAKDAVTNLDLAERLVGGPLVRTGNTYMARCPLPDHEDKTPSFTVYADNGRGWTCFGCNRGGDVVHLHALARGIADMRAAAGELLLEFGHELPQRPEAWFHRQKRQRPIRDRIREGRVEHIRLLVFRLLYMPWLKRLPEDVRDEATESAWRDSWWMADRLYAGRRSA
ncbi:MAG: CHC2 zinc finger domain-containing protein [Rubrobacteraceae bacterium]